MDIDILSGLEQSFNTKPISIVEYAEGPKYCNRKLYPRQKLLLKIFFLEDLTDQEEEILDYWIAGGYMGEEIEISPDIRERIAYLKANGYRHFREVVLVGGRRCSKGFLTGLALSYMVHELLQLQDPNQYYGIDADKEILFSVVAAAQDQAKDMQYADLSAMVNSCMAMQRNLGKMQELEFSVYTETDIRRINQWKAKGRKIQKDMATIRGKALPANSRTIRGSATMAIVFDEFAHFQQGENDQSDGEVYAAAIPALAQFGRDGMIFCNSSPYSKTGKFYERYLAGLALENDTDPERAKLYDPTVLSLRFPSWALFEGWWDDPEYVADPHRPKKCITVSPDWDPERKKEDGSYFYTEDDRAAIIIARNEELSDKVKYKVERRGHFAEVVDAYLDPEMVDRMFKGKPYQTGEIVVIDEEECPLLDYTPLNTNWSDSTYVYKYVAHLDPSSTTAGFGFALGHSEILDVTGKPQDHVVFDIIKRWNPKEFQDGVIDWEPILEEVLGYCMTFRPVTLTFDQHQNLWPMQWLQKELRKRGFGETRIFQKTADMARNWHRAEVFRTALYQNLIHAPKDTNDCDYATLELKYLQEIKTARVPRVEKQDQGPIQTKDVADCIMEVTEALVGSQFDVRDELNSLSPSTGVGLAAPGGHSRALPQELTNWYNTNRQGEQGLGRGHRTETSRDPSRRAFGGRPTPRALPHRRLPGR